MKANRKINVIHVTQYLEIGGLETFIVEFCKQIDKEAFNVSVLCTNHYDENYKKCLEQDNIDVNLIKKKYKYDLLFFLKAAAFLKRKKIEIIHSHGGCFLYSAIIGKLAGVKKIIHTLHGMPITTGYKSRIEEYLSCLMADNIVAVSNEIADDIKSRVNIFNSKIEVIINGIDHIKYTPCTDLKTITESKVFFGLPQDKKIIGSVGRLENVKNYPLLLKAFSELIHFYNNDFHLVFVGNGREESRLKKIAEELAIDDKVSFLGMQYDLPRIYPLFDVFVLSSITEGTSISLLEAQASGIPAVVTDVGGNSNIIQDGINGYLCKSGDHAEMAAKLDRLLNNNSELSRMKLSAREVVLRKFDMNSVLRKYQRIYCGFSSAEFSQVPGRA